MAHANERRWNFEHDEMPLITQIQKPLRGVHNKVRRSKPLNVSIHRVARHTWLIVIVMKVTKINLILQITLNLYPKLVMTSLTVAIPT
jgi:CRISPR/Cas system CMR-associated protein Cmr1 (group 7 of RAMP superfamily)